MTQLVDELVEMLTSPDPTVRDVIAYPALATWIDTGVLGDEQLHALGDRMVPRFEDSRVQARTFAPLVLDAIGECRDLCEASWVEAFERWYATEQDLRGCDAELGWLHAVAHGADLLGTLGRRKDVDPAGCCIWQRSEWSLRPKWSGTTRNPTGWPTPSARC